MELDKKIICGAAIAFLSFSIVFAFQAKTLTDGGYGMLLKSNIALENAKAANAGLFIILPIAVYVISVYLLKADEFHSFAAALLFAVCGANVEALFSISPALAALLGKKYELLQAIRMAGAVLPIGVIALLGYKKELLPAMLATAGLLSLPFVPGISAILLALAAAKAIGILESAAYADKALVLVILIFAFQAAYSESIVPALAAAIFMGIIAYVVFSVHNPKSQDVHAVLLLFVAFGVLSALYSINSVSAQLPSQGEVAAFKEARSSTNGSFGVLEHQNAFAYYYGNNATLLEPDSLLKKETVQVDYVLISPVALDRAYSEKPFFFAYAGIAKDNSGQSAVFTNRRYALYMRLSEGELAVEDAVLYDSDTGEVARIPFTKIKQLSTVRFDEPENRMVNVQDMGGTALYGIIFSRGIIFEQNGTRIIGVK